MVPETKQVMTRPKALIHPLTHPLTHRSLVMYTGVGTSYAESHQRMLQILAESDSNNLNMVFNGTTLNNAFFRKHELQVAAALYLYCQNADGSYADAELIGEIIKDMRGAAGPAPPCQGIETLLRDSPNHHMREAWREVVDNDMEVRHISEFSPPPPLHSLKQFPTCGIVDLEMC